MIDAEIGLHASHRGYCVLQYNGTNATHNLAKPVTHKILGQTIYLYNYPPFRHYYESRNRILIAKEYPNKFARHYIRQFLINRILLIVKVALFEKNSLKKIVAILSGIFNGFNNKAKPYK